MARSAALTRRAALLGAALAAAGCAAPVPERPPIVLVHGAWMGASSWDSTPRALADAIEAAAR